MLRNIESDLEYKLPFMKTNHVIGFMLIVCSLLTLSCTPTKTEDQSIAAEQMAPDGGQSSVEDSESQKNVVHIAIASTDHSTLVTAVKAAELVDALSNTGPFTVFAPVNDAFEKLPEGTVANLLMPEQKEQLQDILQYHVALGVYKTENLRDGQILGMVNGKNVTISIVDGKVKVNGANIVASVIASNGIVHVLDAVLLPE